MLSSATARSKWTTPSASGAVVSTPISSALSALARVAVARHREMPQGLLVGVRPFVRRVPRSASASARRISAIRLSGVSGSQLENLRARHQRAN